MKADYSVDNITLFLLSQSGATEQIGKTEDRELVQRYASFDGLATKWRLTVGQPFKAGILVPRVKTLGYHQPSLRD